MTVNDLLTSGNGRHDDPTESNSSSSDKSSCFFQWELSPAARQEEDKFHCHYCQETIEGSEIKLKLHQIGLHVNPYYLSASDRILAQISSYAVQTDKTEDPWVPDWDTFKGLYRCHHCFLLCNEGSDLSAHLNSSHPKDLPDVDEEEPLIKRKTPKKRRQSDHSEEDIPLAKKFKQEHTDGKQSKARPDRKCKSTTNTLVAMLTADERYFDLQLKRRKPDDLIATTSEIEQVPVAKTSSAKKSNAKKSSKSKKSSKVKFRNQKKKVKNKRKMRDLSRGRMKASLAEQERIQLVSQAVTTKDKPFLCFGCQTTFESFADLSHHKTTANCVSTVPSLLKTKVKLELPAAEIQNDPELDEFVANALTSVPEVTFNNMHGTIHHISSLDGQVVASKSAMGTIEKVKLNLSESWSKNDVWESGWEHAAEPLHWHRYNCLSSMSGMSWAQQKLFKDAYDGLKKLQPPQHQSNFKEKRLNLMQGLNLKQVGKSVKYMTLNERELKSKAKVKKSAKNNDESNVLNGEWENPHDFMCSSCAIVYDELREILHHKWEAHPYCLVAHVTLRQDLQLPPSNMMHPQVGRGLHHHPAVKISSGRKPSPPKIRKVQHLKCSKCPELAFENRDEFYVHVLECGGHEDWDVSKKKKKKKRMLLKRNNSTEQPTNEEVIQRRKARFERFNRPPPLAVLNGGRMTRLQADIIKKDKRDKRKKGKSSKKSRGKKVTNSDQPAAKKVVKRRRRTNFERPTNVVARQRRSTAFYGITNHTNDDSEQIRKIVQQIMDEMLTRIEQAAQVLDKAEEMNLDLATAKLQSRRNSTDSNCSLKVKDQGEAEPIIDLMVATSEIPLADAESESLPISGSVKKRRSSFAASFYSARPTSERSLRRSNGKINYFQNDFEKVDDDDEESSPIRRRKKQKLIPKAELTSVDDEEIGGACSGEEASRPRRQITNNNSMLLDSSLSGSSRVVFPLEVKACAIQRIRDGETQVQVARDLQCPVSTVASWWHRRASILASEATSDSNISSATESEPSEDLPLRPSKVRSPVKNKKKSLNLNRNVLLSQMKERVEAAFAAQEAPEAQETNEITNTEIQEPESEIQEETHVETEPAEQELKEKAVPSSEESSNDAPENNIKLKNTILRTCFASLHRRQKKEKEQEYHQYLNGFD